MNNKAIAVLIAIGVVLVHLIVYAMPITMFSWHDQISGWPECQADLTNAVIDVDLTPSFYTSATAETVAECHGEVMEITLIYPPYPHALNYASEESTTLAVATWSGNLIVHVDPSVNDDGRHVAFSSPPDIAWWVVATVIIVIINLILIGYGAFMLCS